MSKGVVTRVRPLTLIIVVLSVLLTQPRPLSLRR